VTALGAAIVEGRMVNDMTEPNDQVDAALNAGGDGEHIQRVTIIDDDPERAQRIANALALDADEAPPTIN
jgi:hypothetical protein